MFDIKSAIIKTTGYTNKIDAQDKEKHNAA